MNWETIPSTNFEIRDLRKIIEDLEIQLTWFWPNEVDFVYIYKCHADQQKPLKNIQESDLTFYTREEYKANQGYKGRIDGVGRYYYQILPCQKRDGKLVVFNQENEKNVIYVTGSRAKIYFSIQTLSRFWKRKKIVKMSIRTEIPLDRELLVYVKKRGGVPISIEDGTQFPFIRSFSSGNNEQPEIEIEKDEHIRIFFSNGMQSAEIYELIPE